MSEVAITSVLDTVGDREERKPETSGNGANSGLAQPLTLRALRARAEIQAIREVLALTGWNRKQAARLLKVSYRGLLYKIRQHNITRDRS